jgi:hypothetical protein
MLDQQRYARDLWAWNVLAPLTRTYIPWTVGSLAPRALVGVLNDIVFHNRQVIVECGGGASTFFIGRLLHERQSGKLYTIEHSQNWARWLEDGIGREGLNERVSVIVAPLRSSPLAWDTNDAWYDDKEIISSLGSTMIDLLIIDGPPAYTTETRHSRYVALPFFYDHLSDTASVVLDNIDRQGERAIVDRWQRETDLDFIVRRDLGIAVGTRAGNEPVLVI